MRIAVVVLGLMLFINGCEEEAKKEEPAPPVYSQNSVLVEIRHDTARKTMTLNVELTIDAASKAEALRMTARILESQANAYDKPVPMVEQAGPCADPAKSFN